MMEDPTLTLKQLKIQWAKDDLQSVLYWQTLNQRSKKMTQRDILQEIDTTVQSITDSEQWLKTLMAYNDHALKEPIAIMKAHLKKLEQDLLTLEAVYKKGDQQ